jgi:hypothetical protein
VGGGVVVGLAGQSGLTSTYPDTTRTPVYQRYHFVEIEPPEEKYQRPSRHRIARLTPTQIRQATGGG